MLPYLAVLTLILLVAGMALFWWSQRLRRSTGLPAGPVVYSDTGAERAVTKPLFSERYGLVGKPDYLVEVADGRRQIVVPVEVKSRRRPAEPAEGHLLQLAAYCLLVEESFGQRPPYGLLRYADMTLTVPFTRDLRHAVIRGIKSVRQAQDALEIRRSHSETARCIHCGYRHACGSEALP